MAISWTCRVDYGRAGFAMLSLRDPSGKTVARRSLLWSVALLLVSLLPVALGEAGWLLGLAALALGLYLLRKAIAWVREPSRDLAARGLFLATIAYLPTYLGALAVDRFLF